jgi:hypothetical protein
MDMQALQLSLEQEFALAKYEQQVQALSQDRAREFLIEAFRQLMVKDNVIRSLVKTSGFN